ncbi:50S ribosomal protein L3 [Candidatus Curtissbacteria bacterium]|nr:50S ribosomal protein L3 [Candidatus Curtissbacteria bacterium]
MINTLLGIKKEMSARFDRFGRRLPVTEIYAEPNIVVVQKDGRILIGAGQKKRARKTENAFVQAAGFAPRLVKEVKVDQQEIKPGTKVDVSIFGPGDEVKITGVTKGKGFTGVVKRWGFAGGPKTHGQSDRHRAPGSIGQTTTPGRVYKGKKMAGHMGVAKLTITGLEVIEVDAKSNLLIVKGSVPGARNGYLVIEKTGKVKGYTPPPEPKEEPEEEVRSEKTATAENAEKNTENTENPGGYPRSEVEAFPGKHPGGE